jgi:DNA-directed RNA polymerase subunit M/transcription elongation factor TFIIS
VSEELFERVRVIAEKNKHKPAAKKADDEYVLTHKLFCGKCGAMMVGTGGTSRTKQVYHYYKCGNNMYKKSCDKKAVKKDWIEHLVVKMAQDYVLQDDVIDRLADAVLELFNKENVVIPFLKKQLADIEKKINNLVDAIENGITSATTQRRLAELETKKEELEISIAKEQIEKPPLEKRQIVFWISRFKGGDVSDSKYRASIVDIFVNSVFLYDDELVVGFNWKDGTKTMSIKQWEKSCNGEGESGSYLEQCSQFPICGLNSGFKPLFFFPVLIVC